MLKAQQEEEVAALRGELTSEQEVLRGQLAAAEEEIRGHLSELSSLRTRMEELSTTITQQDSSKQVYSPCHIVALRPGNSLY